MVGLGRLELPTPRLSSVCSNQLSYRPLKSALLSVLGIKFLLEKAGKFFMRSFKVHIKFDRKFSTLASEKLLRKEVIQPQVPLRLPCYDFTPVTNPTFAGGSLAVSLTVFWLSQLPWCDGRCVQGPGTYSPRRADPRLLAIPPSRSRIADSDPN